MVRFSRRTRAKSCTKNSVQKNCLHDALLGRLVKNKQKNFSKACFPLHLPTLCSALTPHSDLGLWNFALAGSEYGPGQIWIPLLLPLPVYAYPLSLRLLVLSSLVLGSFSLPLAYLACSPYPDFIFILKSSHVPASMPMLYSIPFRLFGIDVTHFSMPETSNNNFASLMGLESWRPPRSLMPMPSGYCVPTPLRNNKPAYDFSGRA